MRLPSDSARATVPFMEAWLYYEIFGNILDQPSAGTRGLTSEGLINLESIERGVARFYEAHRARITGLYIFHYYDRADDYAGPAAERMIDLRPGQYVEFIRLRFRVAASDVAWARQTLRSEMLESPALRGSVKGWRLVDGYTARADVGARFGDLANGVDPTEAVVKILTGNTELRFYLLDHPGFKPNHDIIHLYFNTLGLFYPEEVAALEARAEKVKGFMRNLSA
jgi:hypothetical protein